MCFPSESKYYFYCIWLQQNYAISELQFLKHCCLSIEWLNKDRRVAVAVVIQKKNCGGGNRNIQ